MAPKKMAIINDLSGYGRCSLTIALPVTSVMGIQACPIPTSIFSNHTGFPHWYCHDFTEKIGLYLEQWDLLNLSFDGIYCGYLGSASQIDIIHEFLAKQYENTPFILIDPVLGDHGKVYSRITKEHCDKIKHLLSYATVITPNLTEACILADEDYVTVEKNPEKYIPIILEKLRKLGPKKIVITGIVTKSHFLNYVAEENADICIQKTPIAGPSRSGTGDLFASIIAAHCLNGHTLLASTNLAAEFIALCIEDSSKQNIPLLDGVCFEPHLAKLAHPPL